MESSHDFPGCLNHGVPVPLMGEHVAVVEPSPIANVETINDVLNEAYLTKRFLRLHRAALDLLQRTEDDQAELVRLELQGDIVGARAISSMKAWVPAHRAAETAKELLILASRRRWTTD